MALATIIYNTETIGAAYAPSLNAAFKELYRLSGIKPVVRAPYGGSRTLAEQRIISPGQTTSDHLKQRGVDIWNHQAIRNRIGNAKFIAVLWLFGWKNVQVNGAPFPSEPWHFANQSSTPQNGTTRPFPNTPSTPKPPSTPTPVEEEDEMKNLLLHYTDTKGVRHWAHTIPGTSFWVEWVGASSDYYNSLAKALGGLSGFAANEVQSIPAPRATSPSASRTPASIAFKPHT